MEFPIDVDVVCTDGRYGKSTAVVVDPDTEEVSFLAVSDPESVYTEYLVPVGSIRSADPSGIELNCSRADVEKMEKFSEAEFLDMPYYAYDSFDGMSAPMVDVYRKQTVPEGTAAISKGMMVEASDGFVGNVDELIIDPESGVITHIVMRTGHIWGSTELTLPVSQVKEVDSLAVYLDRDKESIETLPAVQIRRYYSKKEINQLDISILIWAFEAENSANHALDHLKSIVKEKSIEIRNGVVLEKNDKGKTKVREVADISLSHGGIIGLVAGSLVGLLAGPGGAVLGAAMGATTGRLTAKKRDRGFSHEYLAMLKDKMKPGSSGIVVLVESKQVQSLVGEMESFGGKVHIQKITDGIVSELTE